MELSTVLIWDIDGTLLTTHGRGFPSLVRAVKETLGFINLSENYSNTHGLTDLDVIKNLSKLEDKLPSRQEISAILKLYEKYIEVEFTRNPPLVLPSIIDTLKSMKIAAKYEIAIGTGNSINGARIKLRAANLISFFHGSAFYCSSIQNSTRIDILRNAKKSIGDNKIGIVIGDTPIDIQSAFAVGLKCIAIESGAFSSVELERFKPDALLKRHWASEELFSSIEKIIGANGR